MRVLVVSILLSLNLVYCVNSYSKVGGKQTSCIVKLKSGLIRGDCGHAIYDAYKNIPYAKPPIGELRFESPQCVDKWQGVLSATGPPTPCVQFHAPSTVIGVEDCLKINVYVPKNKRSCLPTAIWIHSGAFQYGAATNDPELFTQAGDIILVTFAYRLGPLGFYSTGNEYISGNMGLKDQRLAMQWVVENIAAFGGDPNQILVFGNSAGAAAVEYHLLVNTIDAKAYAALSGSVLNPWAFLANPEKSAEIYARTLKCPYDIHSNALKNCLKSRSVAELRNASTALETLNLYSTVVFRPTIESESVPDAFLTEHPLQLLKAGNHPKKPYLVSNVKGEGAVVAPLLKRDSEGKYIIEELNERWHEICSSLFYLYDNYSAKQRRTICNTLRERYMCNKPFSLRNFKLLALMVEYEDFMKGIEKSVKLHQAANQEVYRYIADLRTRYSVSNLLAGFNLDFCFGSVHTNDAQIILPDDLSLPPEPRASLHVLVANSLLALIKSLMDDEPKYKNIYLPANVNPRARDSCLYFSFTREYLSQCRLEKVNCRRVKSVECSSQI